MVREHIQLLVDAYRFEVDEPAVSEAFDMIGDASQVILHSCLFPVDDPTGAWLAAGHFRRVIQGLRVELKLGEPADWRLRLIVLGLAMEEAAQALEEGATPLEAQAAMGSATGKSELADRHAGLIETAQAILMDLRNLADPQSSPGTSEAAAPHVSDR